MQRQETKKKSWPLSPHPETQMLERRGMEKEGITESIQTIIGPHCYYIAATSHSIALCRSWIDQLVIVPETLDHELYGVTGEDLEHAVLQVSEISPYSSYYRISAHIERKLRALLESVPDPSRQR